jgi:ABC-type phosphate transport system substrate-binding protein
MTHAFRPGRGSLAAVALAAAIVMAGASVAIADPVPGTPGTPPPGKTDAQIYAAVGADAFAELTNNFATKYNTQGSPPINVLASYDAVNPLTAAAGENILTKPGCTLARPNGANAGVTAIKLNQISDATAGGDGTSFCIDFVRSSRAKAATGESGLTFYAQSRDAVSYATIGNAYAPVAPLTTAQLKDIFECTTADWSQVGGQAGAIHVYLPPASAATLTFFLQAIGSSLTNVTTGCTGTGRVFDTQQNDGRAMNGDPQGVAPYAVTKWAAQDNHAPGIEDNRGGAVIGLVNTTTAPTTTTTLGATTYRVLNPAFADGASAAFGRIFFNVVRNDAPDELQNIFKTTGYLCANEDALLIPFGNTPLGTDTGASRFCGQSF